MAIYIYICWDHAGITLESRWGHFGIMLGSIWDDLIVTLGSLWGQNMESGEPQPRPRGNPKKCVGEPHGLL